MWLVVAHRMVQIYFLSTHNVVPRPAALPSLGSMLEACAEYQAHLVLLN